MEASGKGYETTKQFNNKENPVTIVTEMNTPDFLKRSNGEKLSIIPVNYSGLFIQFEMGFSGH